MCSQCSPDLFAQHRPSEHIRSDNSNEPTAHAIRGWLGLLDGQSVITLADWGFRPNGSIA